MPDERAIAVMSGPWADAGNGNANATTHNAPKMKRTIMIRMYAKRLRRIKTHQAWRRIGCGSVGSSSGTSDGDRS